MSNHPIPRRRADSWLPYLVAILLIAAALRSVLLVAVPPGLQHDEVFHAHDAFTVRQGYTPLWFSSNAGNEPLFIYLMALSTALIGDHALGIRFPALAGGLLTVALTYRWAAAAAGKRAALIAAALVAVSFWPVWMSRVGLRAVSLPPMVALSGWLYTRALNLSLRGDASPVRSALHFAAAGLALGLTIYTYPASIVVPLVFLICTLYLALFRRDVLRRDVRGHAIFWAVAVLAVVPLAIALAGQEGGYLRVQQTAVPLQALRAGDWGPLLDGTLKTLGMWVVAGDPLWRYNIAHRPVFDPITGALFLVGLGVSVWLGVRRGHHDQRAGNSAVALAPLFVLIGVLPSAVTDSPPAFLRASAALPAAYIVLGIGIDYLMRLGARRVPLRALGLGVGLLVAFTAALTVRNIFVRWAGNEEVQRVYRTDLAAIAAYLDAHDAPGGVAISTSEPQHLDRFIFDYTPHGEVEIRWFDGLNALVAPAGDGPAWIFISREPPASERLQGAYLDRVERIEERRFGNGSPAFVLYAAPPGDAFFEQFPPPVGQGVWVSEVMAFPPADPGGVRAPLSLPVQLGDVLQLAGYEMPTRNPASTWLPISLHFRVLRDVGAPEPWVLFAHVLDTGGEVVAQRDFLAVPASTWRQGDVFIQLHDVALPELAPGLYHVEIGLYSQADGSRFPITVDGVAVGDRLLLEPVEVIQP